jgi:hypothetical protein
LLPTASEALTFGHSSRVGDDGREGIGGLLLQKNLKDILNEDGQTKSDKVRFC